MPILDRTLFYLGLLHGLLVSQANRWQSTIGKPLQTVLLGLFLLQIYWIHLFFGELTVKMWDALLAHLFNPLALWCLLVLATFGGMLLLYSILSAKLMKSLVGE